MGGESIQLFAELPIGGHYHRSEPCACGPTRRSAASGAPFAPARSHVPRLQTCRLFPLPPTGRSHHVRGRPAASRAAGIETALLRATRWTRGESLQPGAYRTKDSEAGARLATRNALGFLRADARSEACPPLCEQDRP